jgi:hydrogenase maturation protease
MTPAVPPRLLVACIGNIFLGDDGFGVEVARRFAGRALPEGVTLKDFGIRGLDLAYALMDSLDFVILVDACPRGGEPGSLYVIEPDPIESSEAPASLEAHSMDPMKVLRMVKSMNGTTPPMLIVGCEPEDLGSAEEGKLGLTQAVAAAVDEAVQLIEKLISEIRSGRSKTASAAANLQSH